MLLFSVLVTLRCLLLALALLAQLLLPLREPLRRSLAGLRCVVNQSLSNQRK